MALRENGIQADLSSLVVEKMRMVASVKVLAHPRQRTVTARPSLPPRNAGSRTRGRLVGIVFRLLAAARSKSSASISALSDLRALLPAAVICGRNCLISWVSTSSIATFIFPDDGIVATGVLLRVLCIGHSSKVVRQR